MANQTIKTPRIYPDLISYHRARGSAIGEVKPTTANVDTIGVQTGSADELFDLRPLNQVTFDTSANNADHVLINITFSTASYKQNYIAILNHNLNTALGKIRIFAGNLATDVDVIDAGAIDDSGDALWNGIAFTEVVNADTRTIGANNKSLVVQPGTDGTTILAFAETSFRHWAIQFEGANGGSGADNDETWGSTDLRVGGIMMGEYFDFPFSPDLSLTRSIVYDKVNVAESAGGQRYATSTNLGRTATTTSKSPFAIGKVSTSTSPQYIYGGRQSYNLTFSYMQNTDLLPVEAHTYIFSDDSVISDAWNLVDGPTRPFIFSIDNTSVGSNAESEHLFARFAHNSLDMQQVAPNVYTVNTQIEEEF